MLNNALIIQLRDVYTYQHQQRSNKRLGLSINAQRGWSNTNTETGKDISYDMTEGSFQISLCGSN